MKTLSASLIFMLLAAGCASPMKSSYIETTPAQIEAKIQRNDVTRDYGWDRWNYAGSDDQYDYVYEYVPGSVIPYGFQCYKLPRGDLQVSLRYDFDPAYGNNAQIF